jgi:hypothetical protein
MLKLIHQQNSRLNPAIDEYYTPKKAAEAILPFVPKTHRVWHPFSKQWSAFGKVFRRNGYSSIATHIEDPGGNGDFFKLAKDSRFTESVDCVIDNPPFSLKYEVYKTVCDLGKPFALLMPIPYSVSHELFDQLARKDANRKFIWFKRRWAFYTKDESGRFRLIMSKDGKRTSNVTFSTMYWTGHGLIDDDLYIDNDNGLALADELDGLLADDTGLNGERPNREFELM